LKYKGNLTWGSHKKARKAGEGAKMTVNITAKNYVSVAQAQDKAVQQKSTEQVAIAQDSFKIIAKISSSTRLSGTEKSGLINNVALVEKYAKGNLRSRMLNDITATTIFLERYGKSSKVSATPDISAAIQQFKQKTQISAPAETQPAKVQQQVEQVVKSVESLPKQYANTPMTQVRQKVSPAEVKAVLEQPIAQVAQKAKVEVKEVRQLGSGPAIEQFNVKDEVAISQNAKTVQEITMPGSGGEAVEFAVLGSGKYEEVTLPGGGSDEEYIQADIAARVATLEERGIPEIAMPGSIDASAVAEQILQSPSQAIESIGELILPGGGEENGSVNERAASVALSV
tara:strand:+ start:57985 stop:59010 length:1026 start_codon:yes stop_codon:yes gene_type:complete